MTDQREVPKNVDHYCESCEKEFVSGDEKPLFCPWCDAPLQAPKPRLRIVR